jgi:alcohol dehydrogenase
VPEVRPGRILGHEAVGTVDEVGDDVHRLSPGDRVLVSCISGCGTCTWKSSGPGTSRSPPAWWTPRPPPP